MRKFLRSFPALHANVVMGFGTVARIISGFGRTKLAALLLGPSGVGLLGIGGQVQLLGLTWGSLSISTGFIRSYGSSLNGDPAERKKILATSFTLLCAANIVLVLGMFFSRHWLAAQLFGKSEYSTLVMASMSCIPFQVLIGAYFQGILFSHGRYDDWSRANAVGATVEVAAFAFGVLWWGIEGAFWSLGVGMFFWAASVFRYCCRVETAKNMLSFGFSREVLKELASSSFAATITSTFAYFSGVLLRVKLLAHFGTDQSGAYQAVCTISGLYLQLVMNGIWAQLYPLAGKNEGKAELDASWAESLLITAGMATIFQTVILLAPTILLTLLFSRHFTFSLDFLAWQLWGDFFFLIAQPGLAVLLAKGRFREFAISWCVFYGLSVAIPLALFPIAGAKAVTISYFLLSIGLAVYSFSVFLRGRPLLPKMFWPLLFSFGTLTSISAVASLVPMHGLLVILLRGICCAGAALLFLYALRWKMGGTEKNLSSLATRTKVLNFGRSAFLVGGLDSLLARLCSNALAPRWLVKLAPNHYQYAEASRRSVVREGFRYELDVGDFLDWHIFYGKMEGAKNRLYELAKAGDVIIDVGANIGETALHLAQRAGANGKVVAFEPDPAMREKCQRNLGLNKTLNVKLEPYALSDEKRNYLLHKVSERNPAGNRILLEKSSEFPSVEVVALRLDEYAKNEKLKVSLVKIDVEGFEERVLKGAENLIKEQKPILFIELSDDNLRAQASSAQQLLSLLEEWDYSVVEAVSGEAIASTGSHAKLHCDVICFPKSLSPSNRSFT